MPISTTPTNPITRAPSATPKTHSHINHQVLLSVQYIHFPIVSVHGKIVSVAIGFLLRTPWVLPSKCHCCWWPFSLLFYTCWSLPLNTKLVLTKVGLSLPPMIPESTMTGPQRTDSKLMIQFVSSHTKKWNLPFPSISLVFITISCAGFKYRKDSVMEVSVEDYKKCNSSHPNFFSNTGNTVYHLNHSGYFYFMSGVSGHCERGQRMIIKVISSDQETNSGGEKSSASPSAPVLSSGVFKALLSQLAMSYVASYVFY